jgi:hypothetical protein
MVSLQRVSGVSHSSSCFELREVFFKYLFFVCQIVIARKTLRAGVREKELVSYPLSIIILLSTFHELHRLHRQVLQRFFQTSSLVLMGTSPPRTLPELLFQEGLAKIRGPILNFPPRLSPQERRSA